ncbi:MAG: hypothetical protein Q4E35_06830 [Eubacteriales bacterium]|nr:hypothetical protein [Eubacteriales bacterium]
MDINVLKGKAAETLTAAGKKAGFLAGELAEKAVGAKAELKNVDMGIMLTKLEDLKAKIDTDKVTHTVNELLDGPVTEKVKGMARMGKDFGGFVTIAAGDLIKSLKK